MLMVLLLHTKKEFFIKNFFSKRDQIRRKLRIWSDLLGKFLMENFIFYGLYPVGYLSFLTVSQVQDIFTTCFRSID